MEKRPPCYLYKETRLNLDSTSSESTLNIRLPAQNGSRSRQKKSVVTDLPVATDEATYRRTHMATAASIYYRKRKIYPNSLLWRVLGDSQVLCLQTVDLCKPPQEKHEASLTLRLNFQNSIKPSCIDFSDSELSDSINVFVLTETNDLYTLTLRPQLFHRNLVEATNVGDWCKIFLPSAFSFRYPYRLVARNPQELLISLHDGGLSRLSRKTGDNGKSRTNP